MTTTTYFVDWRKPEYGGIGDDNNDGLSGETPLRSIRATIDDHASDGDTIVALGGCTGNYSVDEDGSTVVVAELYSKPRLTIDWNGAVPVGI
jgi:hypothetical protein